MQKIQDTLYRLSSTVVYTILLKLERIDTFQKKEKKISGDFVILFKGFKIYSIQIDFILRFYASKLFPPRVIFSAINFVQSCYKVRRKKTECDHRSITGPVVWISALLSSSPEMNYLGMLGR